MYRRALLAGGLGLFAGCTQGESLRSSESEDHSIADLRIYTDRGTSVEITVEFTPEDAAAPTLSLTAEVPADGVLTWEDTRLLDSAGELRVTAPDEDIEPAAAEWRGDNEINNRGFSIGVTDDEIEITKRIA